MVKEVGNLQRSRLEEGLSCKPLTIININKTAKLMEEFLKTCIT